MRHLPDLLASGAPIQKTYSSKRPTKEDMRYTKMKKLNDVAAEDNDDYRMEVEESDNEFVSAIIATQTNLINKGTVDLIKNASARKH
ncbi:hypothetical protein ACOME3_000114 [Neoechinorhynchus agilis]